MVGIKALCSLRRCQFYSRAHLQAELARGPECSLHRRCISESIRSSHQAMTDEAAFLGLPLNAEDISLNPRGG